MDKYMNITEANELDLYSIEMDENGNKQIHILGYTYCGDQWELAEICWFIEPLEEFIKHIADNKHYADEQSAEYKQYHKDCTNEEIVDAVNHYFDGKPADYILPYNRITLDTPCGNYVNNTAYHFLHMENKVIGHTESIAFQKAMDYICDNNYHLYKELIEDEYYQFFAR